MLGKKGGVVALFKRDIPALISNHCVAHRLALAVSQSTNKITYLKNFKATLLQLCKFYSNSSVRMAGLEEIQRVLNDPHLRLVRAIDTRWLSHEAAVKALLLCLKSVYTSLEREASERHDCQAEQLETRFPDSDFLEHYKVFDRSFWPEDCGGTVDYHGQEYIKALADHLPFTNAEEAVEEWTVFKHVAVLATCEKSPYSLMIKLLETSLEQGYPNLNKIASVGLIIPVSTADCERGFSTLNRVKTELRGSLLANNLNSLLAVTMEGKSPADFDFNKACMYWASLENRRIDVNK